MLFQVMHLTSYIYVNIWDTCKKWSKMCKCVKDEVKYVKKCVKNEDLNTLNL